MNRKVILLLTALMVSVGVLTSRAASVEISPVPQKAEWGQTTFNRPTSVKVQAPESVDQAALSALYAAFPAANNGLPVIMGKKGDAVVAAVADRIPEHSEGYYLSVTPEGVTIAGADDAGVYYGVVTFLQVASAPEVTSVEVVDWPSMSARGVIEGFYGNPWSYQDRIRQFDFYGANKMNIYIYGPKDDPYHHSRWYEFYPADKAAQMAELVKHATDNKVKFVWAMHPSNSISTDADRQKALAKFEQMYGLGVRDYAIFFDDINANSVDDQISYLNFLTDNFVRKHDDVGSLIVCPTQYNRAWSGGDYLSKMGKGLYPEIRIMWTGNSVCDMIDRADCEWFIGQTGRNPFIWLNYPVNDYGLHHLLMGPVIGNGADVADVVSAFCSNPMQYAEVSKVALYGLADYSWNPEAFNPQTNWERAMQVIAPGHVEAFRTFCINNVDVGPSVHGLRFYGESPEFKDIQTRYPELNAAAAAEYAAQFDKMRASADELLANTDQPELMAEIKEFIEYFGYQGDRGNAAIKMYNALSSRDDAAFVEAYKEYSSLTDKAESLMSRNFSGSIQSVAPRTGSLYVEPFIKKTVGDLVSAFKSSGADYPADLFPAQVVENGLYYIKYNGRYLTNVSGSTYPTFVTKIDDVNPGRQQWYITLEPETGRYKIVNEWDKRYVNEKGAFTVNASTNPYESAWHSYNIYRIGDRYAIQNAGSAGQKFWSATSSRIATSDQTDLSQDLFIFEIVPVEGDAALSYIESGAEYCILDLSGRFLTNDGSSTPTFTDKPDRMSTRYKWVFTFDEDKSRYKLHNVNGRRYVNEYGVFGTNAYANDWNTYFVLAKGDTYAIRNAERAGKDYWVVQGNRINKGGEAPDEPYQFRFLDPEIASVVLPESDANSIIYIVGTDTITVTSPTPVRSMALVDMTGKVIGASQDIDHLDTATTPAGLYILSIATDANNLTSKVVLP